MYWQALENAWPKQLPWKLFVKHKTSQFTIDFKVVIIVFKLDPSSLTSYLLKDLIKSLAYACSEVSNASKNPIAICSNYQSTPKKLITKATHKLLLTFINQNLSL
jgi:hypothetical protein